MDKVVMTRAAELQLAAAGIAGLTNPKVDLFSNDMTPNPNNVWADFTIPTYTGYAQAAGTIGAVYVSQPDNLVSADVGHCSFIGPTAGVGVNAFGWVLSDGTSHAVWAAGRFGDAPESLLNLLDKVSIDIELHLAGSAESETNS